MSILLQNLSPHENLQAIVEQDDRVAYFYLYGGNQSEFGMRSCWVRNLAPAPKKLEAEDMEEGRAPLLSKKFCKHPTGAPPLVADKLRVIWFEEGDAAALLDDQGILAIIPAWSGMEGFWGYARDCKGKAPVCWELGPDNVLIERVEQADDFWKSWTADPTPWAEVQTKAVAKLDETFGTYKKYYAIDGGEWPPKALLQYELNDNSIVLVTAGVCVRPQPKVELFVEDPSPYRRFEVGIALSREFADRIKDVGGYISAQSRFPWNQFTWLGSGHTISCDLFPDFEAVLLTADPKGAPKIELPEFKGDPVNLLWLVPITEKELELTMSKGSQELQQKFGASNWWIHKRRESVV